jgi:hypothetical protein
MTSCYHCDTNAPLSIKNGVSGHSWVDNTLGQRFTPCGQWPKTERNIITVTNVPENDIFMELGETIVKRANHVEPGPRYERWLFHLLRILFGADGRVSKWTRSWNTLWRVDTRPVGGPILRWGHILPNCPACKADNVYYECDRERAIRAEVEFLNKFFLEGK